MNELLNNTTIDKIILLNSASYAFFEADVTNNLIFEGNNNEGKTSVLNSLQLLLLPENNIKDIKNKFRFKPGKDKKEYSRAETYNYYFGHNNSFLIYQITNKFLTFTIILYGSKESQYEYRRILVPAPFQEIKYLFVNQQEEPLILDRQKLILELKKRYMSGYRELSQVEDIKQTLFLANKNEKYNIVPLENLKNDTINNYKVLFKSLYDVSSMGEVEKRKLVSDIINAREIATNNKAKHMNITDIKNEYLNLKLEQKKLEKLDYYREDYEKIIEIIDTTEEEKKGILEQASLLYQTLNIDIKQEDKNLLDFQEQQTLLSSNKKRLDETQQRLLKDIANIEATITTYEASYSTSIGKLKTINKSIDTFDATLLIQKQKEELEICETQILLLNKDIENIKTKMNKSLELEDIKARIKKFHKLKEKLNLDLNVKQQEYQDQSNLLINSDKFSAPDKLKLQEIYSTNIFTLNITQMNDEHLNILKNLLDIFRIDENNQVFLDNTQISKEYKKTPDILKILEDDITNILEEIELTKRKITELTNDLNIQENKDLDTNQEYYKIIQNKEIEIKTISKQQDIWYEIKNIISILQDNPTLVQDHKKALENKSSELFQLDNTRKLKDKEITELNIQINNVRHSIKDNNNILINLEENTDLEDLRNDDFSNKQFFLEFNTSSMNLPSANNIKDIYSLLLTRLKNLKKNSEFVTKVLMQMDRDDVLIDVLEYLKNDFTNIYNQAKIISVLKDSYLSLNESKSEFEANLIAFNLDNSRGLELLGLIVKNIKRFENEINEIFSTIQISNLKKVKIDISLNKKLNNLLDKFSKGLGSDNELSYSNNIDDLNNYLVNHSNNKNEIETMDFIDGVNILTYSEETGTYISTTQSNGTEIMIMLVFVVMLMKKVYKSGFDLMFPIIIDEIGNIDQDNIKNLLSLMKELNLVVSSATPNASPEFRRLFSVIKVDLRIAENLLYKNRKYIVSPKYNPLFKKEILN